MRVPVPVLFLDLDGTVRHGRDELGRFVNGPEDVVIFPEALRAMRAWKAGGGRIAGVTNQGGVALGHADAQRIADALAVTDVLCEGLFDVLMACTHHPDAVHPEAARCWCRKPRAGLLIQAADQLMWEHPGERYPVSMALMVGDRPEDQGAADAACVDFEWAATWRAEAPA